MAMRIPTSLHSHFSRPVWRELRPLLVITLLGFLIVLASYWAFLVPAQRQLVAMQNAYEASRQDHRKLVIHKHLQERVLRGRQELERVWNTLPEEKQFPALAVTISEFGKRMNVSIPGMSYSIQPSNKGLPMEGSIQFSAVGEYSDVYRFIDQLETSKSYLVIESLDAAKTTARQISGTTLVQLHIRVVTFLRPDTAERGKL